MKCYQNVWITPIISQQIDISLFNKYSLRLFASSSQQKKKTLWSFLLAAQFIVNIIRGVGELSNNRIKDFIKCFNKVLSRIELLSFFSTLIGIQVKNVKSNLFFHFAIRIVSSLKSVRLNLLTLNLLKQCWHLGLKKVHNTFCFLSF